MRLALHCVCWGLAVLADRTALARTELLKTQAGSPVHWARAEIVVGIDDGAGSRIVERLDVVHAIARAARAWNRIPAGQPQFRFTTEPERDVTIAFCRGAWQGDAIDLGETKFEASPRDGSVTTAQIELNECDHRFTAPGGRDEGPFALGSVLTHEFGHVLGLGHSDSTTAVMFPNGKGVSARLPDADDETALAVLYVGRQLQPTGSSPATPATTPMPADAVPMNRESAGAAKRRGGVLPR